MRWTLVVGIGLVGACKPSADVAVDACGVEVAPDDDGFDAIAAAFESERSRQGAPGVAVAILQGREIVFARGFGSKDPDADDPVLPTTLFRSGSTLKMQTATAMLQRVDAGEAALDDSLHTHLPELSFALDDAWDDQIELGHLISHQGAFYDDTPIDGGAGDDRLSEHAHGEFADTIWLMAPPGSFWNYANPNFAMAGLVAETLAGRPYRELMRDDVWAPLCMDRSFFLAEDVLEDGDFAYADGWDWTGATAGTRRVEPDSYDDAFSRPAGFAWSNVLDMARFADFLMKGNEEVLSDGLRAGITSEQVNTGELVDELWYGHGLMVLRGFNGAGGWIPEPLWYHNGAVPGFSAELYMLPERELAVAVLSNADGAYYGNAVAAAFSELVDLPAPTALDLGVDPATFSAHVGVYEDPYNVGTLVVGQDEAGNLTIEAPVLEDLGYDVGPTLTPSSRHRFVATIDGQPVGIGFEDGEAPSEYIVNRFFVARRGAARAASRPDRARIDAMLRSAPLVPFSAPR